MSEGEAKPPAEGWSEDDSALFQDYADFFIPFRQGQSEMVVALLGPAPPGPARAVELCCGDGRLSAAILAAYGGCQVTAYDGSDAMRQAATARCAEFGERFAVQAFDLAAPDWRTFAEPVDAVVSSLAVHHLDTTEKRALFADMAKVLNPGGQLIIADLIEPQSAQAWALAAQQWEADVARRAEAAGRPEALEAFRTSDWNFFADMTPDPLDKPSSIAEHLDAFRAAGLEAADTHWLYAGHTVMSARRGG